MKKILIPIDFSAVTDLVLAKVREIAPKFQSEVWLVHIAEPEPEFIGYDTGPQTRRDHVAEHLRENHQKLQKLADYLRSEGINTTALLIQGSTVDKILQVSQKQEITLIIMGSHTYHPLRKILMGSVSEAVLHQSPCPVLIVPSSHLKQKSPA